jgi:hypothetical protein
LGAGNFTGSSHTKTIGGRLKPEPGAGQLFKGGWQKCKDCCAAPGARPPRRLFGRPLEHFHQTCSDVLMVLTNSGLFGF